jgi:hypothetical protein
MSTNNYSEESLFLLFIRGITPPISGKNYATANVFGGPSSSCGTCHDPIRGRDFGHNDLTPFHNVSHFTQQTPKKRTTLRLPKTKNLYFVDVSVSNFFSG